MLTISYAPYFVRRYKKLPKSLQEDVLEKIALLKDTRNHERLKVHKLHGRLAKTFAFSINYELRIIFMYEKSDSVVLLNFGGHDIYER